jgi:regulator of RNase E activity RraA
VDHDAVISLCERYERLYVPAVSDVLDKLGLWNQLLPHEIAALQLHQKAAGPAYTAKGHATIETDTGLGSRALHGLTPGCIAVWDTSGDNVTGHWGELMSNSALARGCRGAVIDGGIRDTAHIMEAGFPVWTRFRSAADARGRWTITDANVTVIVSGVVIAPGDFVFADADGVVVVPAELAEEVVAKAEKLVENENAIREAVQKGQPLSDLYERFKITERLIGRDGKPTPAASRITV